MFWLRLGLKAVLCHTSDLNPALISMAITSFGMVNEYMSYRDLAGNGLALFTGII